MMTDWGTLYTITNAMSTIGTCTSSSVYDRISCALDIPLAGSRDGSSGSYASQGTLGYYWSSSVYNTSAYNVSFLSGGGNIANNKARSFGLSLRCMKN